MGIFSEDKPTTTISLLINNLLTDKSVLEYEPEVHLVGLLDSIKTQPVDGAVEAARAIRKKLKYGSPSVQHRTLVLLELLVSNGGKPLAPLYDDSKLIERLRIMISDDHVIPRVRKKLIAMVIGWKQEFAADPQYAKLVALNKYASAYYKPNRAAATRQVPQFMNDSADEFSDSELGSISSRPVRRHNNALGSSNKDLDTQYEIPAIDISKAGPEIEKIISQAGTNATILKNELASLNRGNGELAVDNDRCSLNFEKCRQIRRKVLRYLQVVNEGHYLGLLIHANDELVDALQMYSDYSKPEDATTTRSNGFLDETEEPESVATRLSDEELYNYESSEDENNPFTDNHKVAED